MTRERYLNESELRSFMTEVRERRHVHQARDYEFFVLLANTGILPSEALSLKRSDLDLDHAYMLECFATLEPIV
jgi:integrase